MPPGLRAPAPSRPPSGVRSSPAGLPARPRSRRRYGRCRHGRRRCRRHRRRRCADGGGRGRDRRSNRRRGRRAELVRENGVALRTRKAFRACASWGGVSWVWSSGEGAAGVLPASSPWITSSIAPTSRVGDDSSAGSGAPSLRSSERARVSRMPHPPDVRARGAMLVLALGTCRNPFQLGGRHAGRLPTPHQSLRRGLGPDSIVIGRLSATERGRPRHAGRSQS